MPDGDTAGFRIKKLRSLLLFVHQHANNAWNTRTHDFSTVSSSLCASNGTDHTIMSNSYQVPDLAKLCSDHFELRANEHCRLVGEASCRWADEHAFLDKEERTVLPDVQVSLLASLCFPTCDIPQLRVATDLLTLLFYWQDKPAIMDAAPCQAAFRRYAITKRLQGKLGRES